MEKIKIITDSACDIPKQDAARLGIQVLPIPLTVDGKGYYEGEDFTFEEFYEILMTSKEVPSTAHVLASTFQTAFTTAYKEGYSHILQVTINSTGSNMFDAAHMAKKMFFEKNPEAQGSFSVTILDSHIYTVAYGYPLMQVAEKIAKGMTFAQAVSYLEDWFNKVEVYFTVFTLDFARKSGRINCAAALVGGVLGLRPVMSITEGESKIVAKVRGDKAAVASLGEIVTQREIQPKSPYMVVRGMEEEPATQLAALMTEKMGYPPVGIYNVGASIAINAGPKVVGVVFLGKDRSLEA